MGNNQNKSSYETFEQVKRDIPEEQMNKMIYKHCDECGCQLESCRCFIHKNRTLCYNCHLIEFDRVLNVISEFKDTHTCTYCERCGHGIDPCSDIYVYDRKAFCSQDCIMDYIGAYELEFSCIKGEDNNEYASYFPKTEVKNGNTED